MLTLSNLSPFASGGNRDCYVHPLNPDRCLKVIKDVRSPEARRAARGFPANLRPLRFFDENIIEKQRLEFLQKCFPEKVCSHLPSSYGMVKTDIGDAFETDLIRDSDGLISRTVEQYIWQVGYDEALRKAIDRFFQDWSAQCPLTRDLIPHNMVICFNGMPNIIMVDGFGRYTYISRLLEIISSGYFFNKRKLSFESRIDAICKQIASGDEPDHRVFGINRSA